MPLQVFRIGSLVTVNTPIEMTHVWATVAKGVQGTIGGLSNSYSHYYATYEEYNHQRYEAGSTLYGPHTLDAYIQKFSRTSIPLTHARVR